MTKKMKLPFLFKNNQGRVPSWPWPSCHQPRTLSFRTRYDDMFKTTNAAYLDAITIDAAAETPESWFTNSSESASFSTAESDESGPECIETLIRGLRSERLFFEPGATSSILEEAKPGGFPFKESMVLSIESQDPYVDFRKSMEEMVEAHGVKDWEGLEELLCWYLTVNGKSNHGYIVGAFVDLLVGVALASSIATVVPSTSCSCSHDSTSSPLSSYGSSSSYDSSSTPCVSSLEADQEEIIYNTPCLSSLLEADDEIKDTDDEHGVSS